MTLSGCRIGTAVTGSFCTFSRIAQTFRDLKDCGADMTPILSFNTQHIDSRFGKAEDWRRTFSEIAGAAPILTIEDAEPVGPKNLLDILLIAPCTGNTLAKLANGITDTPVLMAAKGHLRNQKPVVIFLSSNDALSANLKNVGFLMNMKSIYFVPFGQDDAAGKPNSLVSHTNLVVPALEAALDGKQLQPVIVPYR